MLCAVQILPLRRTAAMSRSSSASRKPAAPLALPWCGTVSGSAVAGTASDEFAEIPDGGHTPGAEYVILRKTSEPKPALSTPTTHATVGALSARLSTPWGAYGPAVPDVPARLRNATTSPAGTRSPPGPESSRLFRTTWTEVPWSVPPESKMFAPIVSPLASTPSDG